MGCATAVYDASSKRKQTIAPSVDGSWKFSGSVARFDEMQSCIKKKNIKHIFSIFLRYPTIIHLLTGVSSFNVRTIFNYNLQFFIRHIYI